MEEHINSLTARRDQLLAVNARLSLPLTPLNAVHPMAGLPIPTSSVPATSHDTSQPRGRTSNYVMSDLPTTTATQVTMVTDTGNSLL